MDLLHVGIEKQLVKSPDTEVAMLDLTLEITEVAVVDLTLQIEVVVVLLLLLLVTSLREPPRA